MPYLKPPDIAAKVTSLATAHPSLCVEVSFPNKTHEGRVVPLLRVGKNVEADRPPRPSRPGVFVMGGIHAREWAPPDAILAYVEALLVAYKGSTGITHAAFTDTTTSPPPLINYKAFTLPAEEVEAIVERLDLFVAPLVNPDGRAWSQSDPALAMWRRNRRPHLGGPDCIGVDLNRNFDIAWKFEEYYNAAGEARVRRSTHDDPCNPPNDRDTYRGPDALSEPETKNVQWLVDTKQIRWFVDVHSYGRLIMYPWGLDEDQSADPTMSFRNVALNRVGGAGGRDGEVGTGYGEFFPDDLPTELLARHKVIGRGMQQRILDNAGSAVDPRAQARSTYTVQPSLSLYPATGTADDFVFSRQIQWPAPAGPARLDRTRGPIFTFTVECGIEMDIAAVDWNDDDGGFQPDYVDKYPKVQREVWCAVHHLLFVASESARKCIIATACFESRLHPHVKFLEALRDEEVRSTALGRAVWRGVDAVYYSFSPRVAGYLGGHRVSRTVVRVAVASPVVWYARATELATRPLRPADARVTALLVLWGLALVAVLGGLGLGLARALSALLGA
jgi:hypothetical protein